MQTSENSSYLSCLDTGSPHDIVHGGFCVPAVTSHLNTIVLDPLFLLKCVSVYLAVHLLERRKEKDKQGTPVDASSLSGMVISQSVTPEQRRWEGHCRWGVLQCTIIWLHVFVPLGYQTSLEELDLKKIERTIISLPYPVACWMTS